MSYPFPDKSVFTFKVQARNRATDEIEQRQMLLSKKWQGGGTLAILGGTMGAMVPIFWIGS